MQLWMLPMGLGALPLEASLVLPQTWLWGVSWELPLLWPFTAARITSATSSSVAPSAGAAAVLFLVNFALSPKAAGTRVAEGLGAAGTDEAAMTARLMLQTPAPCLPPQARPDF